MSAAPNLAGLRPGLADASLDSQRIFRRIMEAQLTQVGLPLMGLFDFLRLHGELDA